MRSAGGSTGRRRVRAAVILVAAGQGRRMTPSAVRGERTGESRVGQPKQFLRVAGRPILSHTIERFEEIDQVSHIVVVIPPGDEDSCAREVVTPYGFQKVTHILAGGEERQTSVSRGLSVVPEGIEYVVVHDGVRPCVTQEQIVRVIDAAGEAEGAILAVPLRDTPKQVNGDRAILKTLRREEIWLAQTPQVFQRHILDEAHARAVEDGIVATDDAALVERLGYRVVIVEGSPFNVKITTADDLPVVERWLKMASGVCDASRSRV